MHLINSAQFFNITPSFLSSACLAANNCAAVLGGSGSGSGPSFTAIIIVT